MSFRVYCSYCAKRITPPYWQDRGIPFCSEEHGKAWVSDKDSKERLMAAAPELLEACKEARATFLWLKGKNALTVEDEAILDRLNASIGKAEGK